MEIHLRNEIISDLEPDHELIIQGVRNVELMPWSSTIGSMSVEFMLMDNDDVLAVDYDSDTAMFIYNDVAYDFCKIYANDIGAAKG